MVTDANNMVMPVGPMYGNGGGGMFGGNNGDWGRYTSAGDFRADLQELMNNAPNEQVRQRLMETMNMM